MYKLASELLRTQFNETKTLINKTLTFLQKHSENELLKEMQEVANDIFDCFEAEYQDVKANDTYIISDKTSASPLLQYWVEQMEFHGIEFELA